MNRLGKLERTAITAVTLLPFGMLAMCLAGCGANLQQPSETTLSPPNAAGTQSVQGAPPVTASGHGSAPAATANAPAPIVPSIASGDADLIVGFRRPTITLYNGENSHEGERVAAGQLSTPMRSRKSGNPGRVEIATASGPRWVARTEVSFANSAARTP